MGADAFGLFGSSDVRAQADLVRRVRNEFAHSIEDLTCDSASIAPLIDQMTLSTEGLQRGLLVNPDGPSLRPRAFTFDGELFDREAVAALVDTKPDHILFFVPEARAIQDRDDRLRAQVHAAVYAVLGLGLVSWLDDAGNGGIAEL